ncbi:hypothetical protein [Streptomyces sp. MMG1121]|uniref:hypothetical protein n=1 Tax=Streptomyces sp. MMG1121 TaxID=1415544 RepID=UPI0006B0565E|nr:hypothetical protein [Streptomyces sp. MMG1121]
MPACPHPPPVTLVMDPRDDVTHTRAALAAHDPAGGRVTVHPTPATGSTLTLACDILAALGKPAPLTAYPATDPSPAWTLCAAWILAIPVTHLTVLRAHLLHQRCLAGLIALRSCTGVRLTLVCHQRRLPRALKRALASTQHQVADAEAVLAQPEPPADKPGTGVLRRRWISLPALTTLKSFEDSPACACTAPPANQRGFTPPIMPTLTEQEVARRLHAGTAHPHLAAELATACFTAASTSQLATARVQDAALDGSTVTLHDRHNVRQGCMTHIVPAWARPLLRAAAFTHLLATGTRDDRLFTDPLGSTRVPFLTDFAEECRLRPPQPPRPRRRKNTRRKPLPPTVWPLSNAHHYLPWALPEVMQGCPQPPGYKPKCAPYVR